MTIAENYKTLLLAILKQAKTDYRYDTIKICETKDKIKKIESKKSLNTKDMIKIWDLESKTRLLNSDKESIITYWKSSSKLMLYDDLVNEELGLEMFNGTEKQAVKDYQTGIYRKGKQKK